MGWYKNRISTSKLNIYRVYPKVELHRHLEGSLRLSTLQDVARDHGITFPLSPTLRSLVQMQKDEPLSFNVFLSKFQTLRLFYRSPKVIQRITREAIEDAAADGILYLELRFTPVALARLQGFQLAEVVDWVCGAADEASRAAGITTRLIVSMNRHEDPALGAEVVELALANRSRGIVGVDLAGNEAEFSADPFIPVLRRAREGGLKLTVHAGEWNGPENVRQAIEVLAADRIGHGVRVMEDPRVVELAAERGIPFEVCLTSNYQTGVIPALSDHPLMRMLKAGLNVILGTDDPSISQIVLSDEYALAVEELGLHPDALVERIFAAARASFLPPDEKDALINTLQKRLAALSAQV